MLEFFDKLFQSDFMSHGHCYLWRPEIVWLHVVSDALICLAYYFIPFTLLSLIRQRRDLAFHWMFALFGLFIFACGTTHLMNIWTVWQPVYRLDGVIKAITALASVPTAILLVRLVPKAVALPSPEALRREIESRKKMEDDVKRLNAELEKKVLERTAALEQANNDLVVSERLLRSIIDSSPMVIYLKDLEGRYQLVNQRFTELFGAQSSGVLGRTDFDIFPAEDAEEFRTNDEAVLTAHTPLATEESVLQNGVVHTYISTKFPMLDGNDQAFGVCGISFDITERKKAEKALRQYNDELQQFSYISSHDLQEPLRIVSTYAQMIERKFEHVLGPDGIEFLGFISGAAQRMRLAISGLTAYSAVVNEAPHLHLIQIENPLKNAIQRLSVEFQHQCDTVTYDPLPEARADQDQIEQVFTHLIGNALKFQEGPSERIHVSVSQGEQEWIFCVEDEGIGIEPRFFDRIFVLFQRLEPRRFPGTGIGLALSKKVVEGHGGRMWVESEPNAGSRFYFTLPF